MTPEAPRSALLDSEYIESYFDHDMGNVSMHYAIQHRGQEVQIVLTVEGHDLTYLPPLGLHDSVIESGELPPKETAVGGAYSERQASSRPSTRTGRGHASGWRTGPRSTSTSRRAVWSGRTCSARGARFRASTSPATTT